MRKVWQCRVLQRALHGYSHRKKKCVLWNDWFSVQDVNDSDKVPRVTLGSTSTSRSEWGVCKIVWESGWGGGLTATMSRAEGRSRQKL